jgi:hypothetical protein
MEIAEGPPKPAMKPATLKNLDIFEGRQGNIEERQYSSKYAIMESAAAFVADLQSRDQQRPRLDRRAAQRDQGGDGLARA